MNIKQITLALVILAIIVLIALGFFWNNGTNQDNINSQKIKVVTSFYPLYFFTKQIAKDSVEVINITLNGVEPHDFEPNTQDMVKIQNANMIILNGAGLESWAKNIKQNISDKIIVVVTSDNLLNQNNDPHIWLDPVLAKKIVDKILQELILIDYSNKDLYIKNANELSLKLDSLDAKYRQGLSNCLYKDIITSHSAFSYLAKEYGFNQIAIAGLSPDAEPSSRQLAEIVKFAKVNNIKYIFFESLASPKLANTLANEIGAKALVLDPIEGLVNDDSDYFTQMQNNLINLKIALNCK